MHPVSGRNAPLLYRNLAHGATGVTGGEFRNGSFSRAVAIDPSRLQNVTALRGMLPMTPTTANLYFSRSAPLAPVRFSPIFAQPRFAESQGLPERTQFANQRQEMHQTLQSQRPQAVPAAPGEPATTDAWKTFHQVRGNVPVPTVPQPRQVPILTPPVAGQSPVHAPPPPPPEPVHVSSPSRPPPAGRPPY
jgi:hypothetical protein